MLTNPPGIHVVFGPLSSSRSPESLAAQALRETVVSGRAFSSAASQARASSGRSSAGDGSTPLLDKETGSSVGPVRAMVWLARCAGDSAGRSRVAAEVTDRHTFEGAAWGGVEDPSAMHQAHEMTSSWV
jgi:hypothetical protein